MANITVTLDDEDKKQLTEFCDQIGVSVSTLFTIFSKKVIREWEIPFKIGLNKPNRATIRAMKEGEKIVLDLEKLVNIDNYGLELLEYRVKDGDNEKPMYMPRLISSGEVTNMTMDGNQKYYTMEGEIILSEIPEDQYYNRTLEANTTPLTVYKTQEDANNNINGYNCIFLCLRLREIH